MKTTFRVTQDENKIKDFVSAQKAVDFISNRDVPKHSMLYVDAMRIGKKEPVATIATKSHGRKVILDAEFEYYASKTVKSYDGETDVNIKGHQNSLQQYPARYLAYLNDDGRAGIMDAVYSSYECGCKIKGNGTLQFPISIEYCKKHSK